MSTWQERDLAHIWHPCSQMKDYETLKPIVIDHGKGIYLYDIDGNEYIDIVSSWWCNLLGHCNPTINECVKNQIDHANQNNNRNKVRQIRYHLHRFFKPFVFHIIQANGQNNGQRNRQNNLVQADGQRVFGNH